MKRILYTFLFFICLHTAHAQDETGSDKIRERMTEYIQQRLDLSKSEQDRFKPAFTNYFNELRKTNQDNKDDQLVKQQKIADLRLRYREQFKAIMGEKKSNDVFTYEMAFIKEVRELRKERRNDR